MIRCNVCDILKEENEFQKYWHSTQNKMRTRKQCTECLYQIRLKKKNPDKYYSSNPNYRKCTDCKEWKLISTSFYTRSDGSVYLNRCRECEITLEKNKRKERLKENCGSDRVPANPNTYTDEYQKSCTFELLELLGYLYDTTTGIWIKPGHKEIIDGKPYFPNIKINSSGKRIYTKRLRRVTPNKLEKIIQLKLKGWSMEQIADELGMSEKTVYKHYLVWKNQSKSEN